MLKRLMVGYDFSDPSRRALEVAREMSQRMGLQVSVVHVVDDKSADPKSLEEEPLGALPVDRDRHMEALYGEMVRTVETVFREDAGAVDCHVLRGTPWRVLVAMARQVDAQVVAVGTTGKGLVRTALLGSVSHALVEGADGMVLTVR